MVLGWYNSVIFRVVWDEIWKLFFMKILGLGVVFKKVEYYGIVFFSLKKIWEKIELLLK